MANPGLDETVLFLVNVLRRLLFGFECVRYLEPEVEDGSPEVAFYFDAIYNYTALLFLLDRKKKPMGGSAYPALHQHGLEHVLEPIASLLGEPVGDTSFGDLVLKLRNKAIVHSSHSNSDFELLEALVDTESEREQLRWRLLLDKLRLRVEDLEMDLIDATGRPLSDFGFE